jgi:hypothetical protein
MLATGEVIFEVLPLFEADLVRFAIVQVEEIGEVF